MFNANFKLHSKISTFRENERNQDAFIDGVVFLITVVGKWKYFAYSRKQSFTHYSDQISYDLVNI
jgi:hypothetical protein